MLSRLLLFLYNMPNDFKVFNDLNDFKVFKGSKSPITLTLIYPNQNNLKKLTRYGRDV